MKPVKFISNPKTRPVNSYICDSSIDMSGTYYKAEDVEELLIEAYHSMDDYQGNRQDWRERVKKEIQEFESHKKES